MLLRYLASGQGQQLGEAMRQGLCTLRSFQQLLVVVHPRRSVVPLSIFQSPGSSSSKRTLAGQLVFPAPYVHVWILQVSHELQQNVSVQQHPGAHAAWVFLPRERVRAGSVLQHRSFAPAAEPREATRRARFLQWARKSASKFGFGLRGCFEG